jgi:hypothetical protein
LRGGWIDGAVWEVARQRRDEVKGEERMREFLKGMSEGHGKDRSLHGYL